MKNNNSEAHKSLVVYTDGGSRGNPGHGAIGVAIYDDSSQDKPFSTHKQYLGSSLTNNEAEYQAVIIALEKIFVYQPESVQFYLDSELVVKQLSGEYKVKQPHLQRYFKEIQALSKSIPMLKFNHVPRKENKLADSLVNQALDEVLASK